MPLNTNLVEFWPLTTNNLVGAFAGNVLTQGGGLTWDSTNSCWTVTSSTNPYLLCTTLTLGHPFTVAAEVWVNGGAAGDYTFVGYLLDSSNYWQTYQSGSTNLLQARSRAGGSAGDANGGGVSGSVWNQTAGVYASTTDRKAYLAGTLSAADTTSINPTGASKNFTIGSLFDGSTATSMTAVGFRFRNVAVWSRTLTQSELASYFSNPSSVLTAAGPNITGQPADQSVTAGATATFSVTATASGGGTLSYQWQRNGVNISGATSASYTTPATTVSGGSANNGDVYKCNVTETGGTNPGTVASNNATLTVTTTATLTIPVVNNTNQPLALLTIPNVTVQLTSTRAQVLSLTNQVTNGSGNLVISSSSLASATSYIVNGWNADGSSAFITQATAL